jgi:RND family efflux transporter MFP subunit
MAIAKRLPALLAAGLLALVGCESKPARPRLGEVERLPSLETVKPRRIKEKITVDDLLATVEAYEKADLCSQVQGDVKDLDYAKVDIGKPVTKGQVLARLDVPALVAEMKSKEALRTQAQNLKNQADKAVEVSDEELKEARLRVKRAHIDLEDRQLKLKRVRELVAKKALQPQLEEEAVLQRSSAQVGLEESRAQVVTKTVKLEAARAEVKTAASRVEVAEADYKLARAKVELATIRAPFNGVITKRWVDNGATIKDPTTPLFTVMRTDMVRVLIDVPERYVPLIRSAETTTSLEIPNEVDLFFPALDKDWKPVEAPPRITRTARSLDMSTRTLRCEVHLGNVRKHESNTLKPGMTGKAKVVLDDGTRARLTIPSTALVRVGPEIRVYYIDKPHGDPLRGEVKATVVTLGLDNGKTVEVLSGLTDDQLVIAKGNGVLGEGTAIAVELRETKH